MDVKDKKIIAELLLDSRISFTQLAKNIGVSREVAQYRVKKLEDKGVILQYYLALDYEALGFTRHNFFMQLKGVDAQKEDEIMTFLAQHKNVTYLGPIVGKWNCAFDLLVRNNTELKNVVQEITDFVGVHLASFVVYHGELEGESFPTKFVGITRNSVTNKTKKHTIDTFDKKILQLLATNARVEYKELSKKLKKPANTIAFRVKRMLKTGVIHSNTISVDYKTLGLSSYDVQIKANTTNIDKLIAFVKQHVQAWYYFRYVGNESWDLDVGFLATDTSDLRKFLIELKQFSEVSHIHDIYLHESIMKDNIAPAVVFE